MMEKFNIFAGDLSYFCTEQDLINQFSLYGNVEGAIIRKGKRGDSLHYGFVKMNDSDAQAAVEGLQGKSFMGRNMRLNIESPDTPRAKVEVTRNLPQVHVSFLSSTIRDQVNEELLIRQFSRFGNVVDCVIKQYQLSLNPHRQCGYGFVYFSTCEEATSTISAMKNSTVDGVKFDCSFSREYSNNNDISSNRRPKVVTGLPSPPLMTVPQSANEDEISDPSFNAVTHPEQDAGLNPPQHEFAAAHDGQSVSAHHVGAAGNSTAPHRLAPPHRLSPVAAAAPPVPIQPHYVRTQSAQSMSSHSSSSAAGLSPMNAAMTFPTSSSSMSSMPGYPLYVQPSPRPVAVQYTARPDGLNSSPPQYTMTHSPYPQHMQHVSHQTGHSTPFTSSPGQYLNTPSPPQWQANPPSSILYANPADLPMLPAAASPAYQHSPPAYTMMPLLPPLQPNVPPLPPANVMQLMPPPVPFVPPPSMPYQQQQQQPVYSLTAGSVFQQPLQHQYLNQQEHHVNPYQQAPVQQLRHHATPDNHHPTTTRQHYPQHQQPPQSAHHLHHQQQQFPGSFPSYPDQNERLRGHNPQQPSYQHHQQSPSPYEQQFPPHLHPHAMYNYPSGRSYYPSHPR